MEKKKFVYHEEAKMLVGWLEELQENLKDIYAELTGGSIPAVPRIGELVVG